MILMFIEIESPEYAQALQLRYRLFYQEHGIAIEAIASPKKRTINT